MFSNFLRLLAFVPIFAFVGCSSSSQSSIDSIYFSATQYDFVREGFCGITRSLGDDSIKEDKGRCFTNLSNSCDNGNMRDCAALGYLLFLWSVDESNKDKELLKKACDGKYGSACGELGFMNKDLEMKYKLYKQGCEYGDFMSCYRLLWWEDESDKSTMDWAKKRAKKLSTEACETMQKIIATEPEYDIYIKGVGNLKDLKKVDMFDKIYIQGIGLESEFKKMQHWVCYQANLMQQRFED